jgi:hypothetical protein
MEAIRVCTYDGPGAQPVIRTVPWPKIPKKGALISEEGRLDKSRRLRGLRHRSAYSERPLAKTVAVAVRARPRDRRRAGRGRLGIL